jgi:hypothetical protein
MTRERSFAGDTRESREKRRERYRALEEDLSKIEDDFMVMVFFEDYRTLGPVWRELVKRDLATAHGEGMHRNYRLNVAGKALLEEVQG